MHARKIALHRNSIIALVMTLLVIGSVLAIAGNSTAISPQKGTVNYTATYLSTNGKLPAFGAKVTVSTLSGYQVATLYGATNYTSLPFGSYIFTLQPYVASSGTYVVNGTSGVVNVTSTTGASVNLATTAYLTHEVNVTVNGITSGNSATVAFSTESGFVFNTVTTSGNFAAALPYGGFFATVTYGGQSNTTFLTSVGATQTLYTTGVSSVDAGIVKDQNGQAMQNFNVVAINDTSGALKYTVLPFTAGAFQFVGNSSTHYVITANGYKPMNYVSGTFYYNMTPASSNVYYNYTLGNNPANLYLSVTYKIGNSTALPFMPNATIGSYYWQNIFDGLSSKTSYLQGYVDGLVGNYSDYSILVNGYNYKQTSTTVVTGVQTTGTGMTTEVNYTFQNLNVTSASLANGFTVKLFAAGTQYTSGALYYNYVFNYNISGVSLYSPVSAANTFVKNIDLIPQTNSGFLNLVFSKVSENPFITASQINLYWNNTSPQGYLVSSNSTSAVFLAPVNEPVNFNVSNAFFNPAVQTNTNDYAKASYTWTVNGTSSAVPISNGNSYNASITFPGFAKYTVKVSFTSSSSGFNSTTFIVYAYNGTPTSSLNVTSQGKTLVATQVVSSSKTFNVPQSNPVEFSAYASNMVIPGTTYNVPLLYKWYFPGYTNTGANVTQTFNTPWISSKAFVTGYLDVSSAVGVANNVTLSLNVTDTTPPDAVMTLQNSNYTTISQPVAGQIVIFNGSQSTDKYSYPTPLSFSWKIVYANGTQVAPGNNTYELVNNVTNSSTFVVRFNTLNSLIVSMEVTNGGNVSAYKNFTTSVVVNSPRLIIQSVYFPTTPAQDASTLVDVNVSNNGTVNANSFTIVAFVNGKNVSFQSYGLLPVGTTKQFEFNLTSPTSGNVQFVFKAFNSSQPSFFADANSLTVSHNVNAPAYQTPLIIGVVIAVIVLIGVAYYKLSSGRPAKPKEKKPAQKKSEEKKK